MLHFYAHLKHQKTSFGFLTFLVDIRMEHLGKLENHSEFIRTTMHAIDCVLQKYSKKIFYNVLINSLNFFNKKPLRRKQVKF